MTQQPTTQFSFDVSFQRTLLRLVMLDDAFAVRCFKWVRPEHFTTQPLGWIYSCAQDYWKRYHMRLPDTALREAVRYLPQEQATRYHYETELVMGIGGVVPEAEYIKDKLADFIKQAIFAQAHQRSATLFNSGAQAKAYDVMAKAQERILEIDFSNTDRIWFFDELRDRQRSRLRDAVSDEMSACSTGIPQLDEMTDGGVHPGELWAVLAYAKRCKTTWLINQGFHATRVHRQPTLHVILEGKGRVIANRYDSRFSGELYKQVKRGEINAQTYRHLAEDYEELRRLLVVRTLNDWDVTILDIQAELHYLRSQGFAPEMLILDYMDLGRARDGANSELEHQVAFARDLKRLVNNEDLRAWSAWQAQRPKPGAHTREHVLSSSSVADAYAKVRIVNAYGSLNATDDEMAEGTMRVFWEGHRDAAVNKVWQITNDLSRQRMVTGIIEEREDAA